MHGRIGKEHFELRIEHSSDVAHETISDISPLSLNLGVIPKDDIENEEDSFIACRHCDEIQMKVEKYAKGMCILFFHKIESYEACTR